jgi:cation:H+ antiporter
VSALRFAPVLADVVWLAVGLVALIAGGELLIRAASKLARALGISPLMVGLTVVAFGTSAPELAVSSMSALEDRGGIALGNVVGSNLANIGLVIGCTAMLRPIRLQGVIIAREIPMMLLGTAAAIALASDAALGAPPDAFTRGDGCVLLLLFLVFLYYAIGDLAQQRARSRAIPIVSASPSTQDLSLAACAALCAAGLALLGLGAESTVRGASHLARSLGVSEELIGLTLVAIGTSLPELVSSLVATLRGQSEIAIGNLIGSNIFNLLFVLGLSVVLRPIPVAPAARADLLFTGALSLLLLALSLTSNRRIVRGEAALLLTGYAAYLTWRMLAWAA